MSQQTTLPWVLVKHSREYSSGQLEHLASYFATEEEAQKACDQANDAEWEKLADGLGEDNTEDWRDGYMGDCPACWTIAEEAA